MIATAILSSMPYNAGIVRIHVGGDFFNKKYFRAWLQVSRSRPDILFYAYTKAIGYWIDNLGRIPKNLVLTASYGGIYDNLIRKYKLPSALVVKTKYQARKLGLPVDSNDAHAANPNRRGNFALLVHGIQPKGSLWK